MNERSFGCHYYHVNDKDELVKNLNNACWAGLRESDNFGYINYKTKKVKLNKLHPETKQKLWDNLHPVKYNFIYIDEYISKDITDENRIRIVNLINKITPCKFVTIKNKKYIEYKLINNEHYASNLVLLNIIRMMWYCDRPEIFNWQQFYKDIHLKRNRNEDPLSFILKQLKKNIRGGGGYYGNHSIILKNIKLKTTEQLLKNRNASCDAFLTS